MLDKIFRLQERNTSVKTEIIAGVTTFLTMAYIIFVNPAILSETGMDKSALIVITCLTTAISTLITGLYANAPIAMAPGMGLNAFFTYTLVITDKIPWQTALGMVFISGFLCLVLTLLGFRKRLVEAIPQSLISAISVGIGLFITFIGLQNLGIVIDHPVTLVQTGKMSSTIVIGLTGLAVMIFLEAKNIKGSLLIGIITATIIAIFVGKVKPPDTLISTAVNIAPIAFKLNIGDALKLSLLGVVFTLMFMDMFDSLGTLVACCHEAKMVDETGQIKKLDRLLAIDAVASMLGAVLGTSTTTSYIESASGIEQGGRTGLTAVVTGVLFIVAIIFVPVVGVVPGYATAPALIMVGLFMMKEVRRIEFNSLETAFPAFIITIMIALSYSISTGLAFGFISFAMLKIIAGKISQIKPTMWLITVLSVLYFVIPLITKSS